MWEQVKTPNTSEDGVPGEENDVEAFFSGGTSQEVLKLIKESKKIRHLTTTRKKDPKVNECHLQKAGDTGRDAGEKKTILLGTRLSHRQLLKRSNLILSIQKYPFKKQSTIIVLGKQKAWEFTTMGMWPEAARETHEKQEDDPSRKESAGENGEQYVGKLNKYQPKIIMSVGSRYRIKIYKTKKRHEWS